MKVSSISVFFIKPNKYRKQIGSGWLVGLKRGSIFGVTSGCPEHVGLSWLKQCWRPLSSIGIYWPIL
jgi:hypothetical protein